MALSAFDEKAHPPAEKEVAAALGKARAAGLPPGLLAAIDAAPRYAEGRGFCVEVRALGDARAIARLAGIKRAS